MIWAILISLGASTLELTTPLSVNFLALVVSRYLAAGRLRLALAAALAGGLLLELFSPWRLGMLLVTLLLSVAIVRFTMTRFFSLSGLVAQLGYALLFVVVALLPAVIISRNLSALGNELLATVAAMLAIYAFSYGRSRLVRGRV